MRPPFFLWQSASIFCILSPVDSLIIWISTQINEEEGVCAQISPGG
jgi:hypothetical protein